MVNTNPYDFTLFAYNLTLIPMLFFSILFLILTLVNLLVDREHRNYKKPKQFPFITVQIPTFNDPIAVRCVERCIKFDYPSDKYEIIIVDDSTNIETQCMLKKFSEDYPNLIKYIHRNNREGFKPGALKNAMRITKGEIIVIFDSDWIPRKNFLRKIVRPFADPKVAIVQTRQGFYNKNVNIITRFASYLLTIYYTIIMPINNRVNCVFFCGTSGAIRRSAFVDVGGWNINSVTEDSDLSVRILMKGYKTVYLDYATPSEVPETFEAFIKQQMRWCYGNARVFFDNAWKILFGKELNLRQKFMIVFITLANSSTFVVLAMTLFGLAGWFLGEPKLFTFGDLLIILYRFMIAGGFAFAGIVTLLKRKQLNELFYFIFSMLTMGMILCVVNAIAFYKSFMNQKLSWFCTPKTANSEILKNDSS